MNERSAGPKCGIRCAKLASGLCNCSLLLQEGLEPIPMCWRGPQIEMAS